MMRIWVMAGVTFREAARKRILWMAFAAGGAFLALFATALHFQVDELNHSSIPPLISKGALGNMLMTGLYASDLLIVVMTILLSADTLSGEISSGAIQAVATKPIHRWELLAGKWLGFSGMLTMYMAFMVLGLSGISYVIGHVAVRHLPWGFGLIWMESMLLLSITLFLGTMFSTLTNGVLALGLHGLAFLGGWIEQIGTLTKTTKAANLGVVASLLIPSEALWRRASFEMQSPLAGAFGLNPFSAVSVPSPLMIGYAGLYALVFLALAFRKLEKRDL